MTELDKKEKLHIEREILEKIRETLRIDIIQLSKDIVLKVEQRLPTLEYKYTREQRECIIRQIRFKQDLMSKEVEKINTRLKAIWVKIEARFPRLSTKIN